MTDYQEAIDALLAAAGAAPVGGPISSAQDSGQKIAGWSARAWQAVGRLLGLAPNSLIAYAEARPSWASRNQAAIDSFVVSQLPDGVTVDDWISLYLDSRPRPTRENPLARATDAGRPVPTPPMALLHAAAGELGADVDLDESLPSAPLPPGGDGRPRIPSPPPTHGGLPVYDLPQLPEPPYGAFGGGDMIPAPDTTNPVLRGQIGRYAQYFAAMPTVWRLLVGFVNQAKVNRGTAPNEACIKKLATQLPAPMQEALSQFQCGFAGPVGMTKAGEDAFMLLKIYSSGVPISAEAEKHCGCG